METLKLSIIVPVYNVAPYLRKCVDSLLAQNYDDYEIILVDDGSTDDSPQICDEYERAYPRPLPKGKGDSFASVWGAHTADSTQYNLLKENAQENRKNPTEAEAVLWDMLKGNNIGMHFRRQHIILDYIVDFICLEKGLVIELDGGYHNDPEQEEYDKQRTDHLTKLGYTELRFTNEEFLTNPDAVIERIKSVTSSLPSFQGRVGVRPPIRVIHQVNAGLSAARNSGILAARGEYLCFVDSDDYWEPNVLGGLMAQVERENLDVLRFDYQNVRLKNEGEYEVFQPNKDPKRDVDYSESVVDGETFLNERLGPACYAVMFILRCDIILNLKSEIINHKSEIDDCLFTPGIYFEDTDWTPRMLLRAKRVASTPMVVYNYLWRTGSITLPTDPIKRKKVLEDKIRLIRGFQEQSKLVKDPIWFTWMTSSTAMGVLGMLSKIPPAERKPYLQELKSLHVFPLSTKKEKMLSQRVKTYLANVSPNLYCKLMNIRK